MIVSWMVYAVVVGMLVSLAALAAERALLLARRPIRGVWATALFLSVLIPAVRRQARFEGPGTPSTRT